MPLAAAVWRNIVNISSGEVELLTDVTCEMVEFTSDELVGAIGPATLTAAPDELLVMLAKESDAWVTITFTQVNCYNLLKQTKNG